MTTITAAIFEMRSTTIILAAALLLYGAVWLFQPHGHSTTKGSVDSGPVQSVEATADSPLPIPRPVTPGAQSLTTAIDSVETLCDEERFPEALALAANADDKDREDKLRIVLSRWAQVNPEEAMQSLASITDETMRTALFQIVADVWSANDPAALAKYAIALPSGDDHAYAFSKAADNWSLQDPATMGEWLNSLSPSPEIDRVIAALIAKTDSENRSPEIAVSWVEGISDPELRSKSLEIVAKQWAETDLNAAEKFVATADWLTSAQRAEILHKLTEPKKLAYED